jgi:hypothetical protein
MILPIDFMTDFYGVDKNMVSQTIPFYCTKHNKNLIEAYEDYLKQLRDCITKADSQPEEPGDSSYNCVLNIANLSHPEFNYEKNNPENKLRDELSDDEFCKLSKPTYHDDSLDFSWSNDVPELNIMTYDHSNVAKSFYEYYEKDIKNIENNGRSSVTLSELRDLKEFFIKVVHSYKDYDSDFLNIYKKLS